MHLTPAPRRGLRFALLLVALAWSLLASAQEAIVARGWIEDPESHLTWEQVRDREPQPFDRTLTRGFSGSTFWIRLTIDPSALPTRRGDPFADRLLLRISPTHTDEIVLYDPLAGDTEPRVTGGMLERTLDEAGLWSLGFVIPRGDTTRDIWLRVRSTHSILVRTTASPFDQGLTLEQRSGAFHLAMIVLAGLPIAWALQHAIAHRSQLALLFMIKQAATLVALLTLVGATRALLSGPLGSDAIDRLTTGAYLIVPAVAYVFELAFLRSCGAHPRALWVAAGPLASVPICIGLLVFDQTRDALYLSAAMMPIRSVLMLGASLTTGVNRSGADASAALLPRWLIVGMNVVWCVISARIALPTLGVGEPADNPQPGMLFYGVMSALLMVAMLQYRANLVTLAQRRAARDLELSREQVRVERAHREDREQLLSMLAHELRTPLASIGMLMSGGPPDDDGARRIRRSLDDMNAVIDRCLQAGRLDDDRVPVSEADCDVGAMLRGLPDAQRESVRIDLQLQEPLQVRADPQLLRVVLGNLVDNALKYGAPGEPVRVSTGASDRDGRSGVEITVENRPGSAGLPDPKRVFAKYYRSAGAHRQTGSGLGLYLVLGLTRQMGGEARYAPDGDIVRFVLWLPR